MIYAGDGGLFKVCNRCDGARPLGAFRKHASKPFGAGYACRDCVNAAKRLLRSGRTICCAGCGETIPATTSNQRYCEQCAGAVVRARTSKGGFSDVACAACAAIFTPNSGAQKYCSLDCRAADENASRRLAARAAGVIEIGSEFKCEMCELPSRRTSGFIRFCDTCRPSARKAGQIDWRERNKDKIKARKALYRKNPRNNIDNRMGCAIWQCLRERKAGWRWEKLVGYTTADLMSWLEKQFSDGMSWNNIGEWHIDHVIPKSSFIYEAPDDDEFKACWALTNLRPLWSVDNLKKGSRRTLLI